MNAKIVINKDPSFYEVWHEGYVEYEDTRYYFWLIDPQRQDEKGNDYEIDIRWFFKSVPMDVRRMQNAIIEAFKKDAHDNRKNQD